MMASAQVVETSVNTNNSPSQDYTTNPDDHSNHNIDSPGFSQIFHCYNKYSVHLLWQTRKIKSIFKPEDKNQHPSHVIYEGNCSCGESYVGETMRNVEVRTAENNDPTNNSEPARILKQNKSHKFTWKVTHPARKFFKRKILEGLFIQQKHPSLNKQINCYIAKLSPAGIT